MSDKMQRQASNKNAEAYIAEVWMRCKLAGVPPAIYKASIEADKRKQSKALRELEAGGFIEPAPNSHRAKAGEESWLATSKSFEAIVMSKPDVANMLNLPNPSRQDIERTHGRTLIYLTPAERKYVVLHREEYTFLSVSFGGDVKPYDFANAHSWETAVVQDAEFRAAKEAKLYMIRFDERQLFAERKAVPS